MKKVLGYIVFGIFLLCIGYGSFKLNRYIHYKFSYKQKIEQHLEPVNKKLNELEKRIERLEDK